ncbi:MAG TPA: AbrB family transcriptional regulator [Peptococcaceae bacterium]|nr:AbrB family transcriptional regulator [Peptococcaceae bacterium]
MTLEQAGLIIVLALLGFGVLKKIGFPASTILGPLVFIGTYQVLGGGLPLLPAFLSNTFLIIIGLNIGTSINRDNVEDIKKMWAPSLVIAAFTLVTTLIMTLIFLKMALDLPTALFSAAPGGIAEMAILGLAYKANVATISTFQVVRYLVIIGIVPLLVKYFQNKNALNLKVENPSDVSLPMFSPQIIGLYVIGILGGLLLIALGVPGGGILGSMPALGVANIVSNQKYNFPSRLMRFALWGVGINIGLEFSPEIIMEIKQMLLPIIGFSLAIVISNLLVGWLISYLYHWDLVTALLSSAPGGLSQMVAVTYEMKADVLKVSILQLVRVLTILTSVPLAAALIIT